MSEISIIIPVYNEIRGIESTLESVHKGLEGVDYHIFIVNDGSTDSKYDFLSDARCTVLQHNRNRGYGASLKTGIRAAKSKWIGIIDADGTYNGLDFKKLWGRITPLTKPEILNEEKEPHIEPDMVVGARVGWNSKIPLVRRPAKFVLNKLANFLSGTKIPDLNSGLRIFKKDLAMRYIHLFPNGFSLTSTITLAALCNDYVVEFIPIDYNKRSGSSKIRPIKDTKDFFLTVVRTVLYFNPLKVCVPLSFIFALIAIGVLLYSNFILHKIMDGTVGVFANLAIQTFILGLLADLFVRRTNE